MMHKTHKKKVLNKSKKSKVVKNAFRLSNNKRKKYFRKTKNQKIQKGGKIPIEHFMVIRNYPNDTKYFWNQFILSSFWVYESVQLAEKTKPKNSNNIEEDLPIGSNIKNKPTINGNGQENETIENTTQQENEKKTMDKIYNARKQVIKVNNSISYLITDDNEFYIILNPFKEYVNKMYSNNNANDYLHGKIIIIMNMMNLLNIEMNSFIIDRINSIYIALNIIASNKKENNNDKENIKLILKNICKQKRNDVIIPCYDVEAMINMYSTVNIKKYANIHNHLLTRFIYLKTTEKNNENASDYDKYSQEYISIFMNFIITIISTLYFNYFKIKLNYYIINNVGTDLTNAINARELLNELDITPDFKISHRHQIKKINPFLFTNKVIIDDDKIKPIFNNIKIINNKLDLEIEDVVLEFNIESNGEFQYIKDDNQEVILNTDDNINIYNINIFI